jgi:hypothetical protein
LVARRITIPRYRLLAAHWRRFPRPEWLIAGYLGFKPKPEPMIAPPVSARAIRPRVPPPSGAMQMLFQSLGGQPGKTVVVST